MTGDSAFLKKLNCFCKGTISLKKFEINDKSQIFSFVGALGKSSLVLAYCEM